MKKLFIISILFAAITASAQRYISHKNTGITVKCTGLNTFDNIIGYDVQIPLTMLDSAVRMFPQAQGNINITNGYGHYTARLTCVYVSNVMDTATIWQSDLGQKVKNKFGTWEINIILLANSLNINLADWNIIDN